jgi:hypothetical protein
MEMMPGMNQMLPLLKGHDGNAKLKSMINILDSMTDEGSILFCSDIALFVFSFIPILLCFY